MDRPRQSRHYHFKGDECGPPTPSTPTPCTTSKALKPTTSTHKLSIITTSSDSLTTWQTWQLQTPSHSHLDQESQTMICDENGNPKGGGGNRPGPGDKNPCQPSGNNNDSENATEITMPKMTSNTKATTRTKTTTVDPGGNSGEHSTTRLSLASSRREDTQKKQVPQFEYQRRASRDKRG